MAMPNCLDDPGASSSIEMIIWDDRRYSRRKVHTVEIGRCHVEQNEKLGFYFSQRCAKDVLKQHNQ